MTRIIQNLARGAGLDVLLADPQPARRQGLLRSSGSHRVITAAALPDALQLALRLSPDIVLIAGEFMADRDLRETLRQMRALGAHVCALLEDRQTPPRMPPDLALDCILRRRTDTLEGLLARIAETEPDRPGRQANGPDLILIGASTGGISAIEEVLTRFPQDCPPTLVVQHIRAGYIARVVQRLDESCAPSVIAARSGMPLQRGMVAFAPDDDRHLTVSGTVLPRCVMQDAPPCHGHRPAVDPLFASARGFGDRVAAAVMTGMGSDGAAGLAMLRKAGAFTLVQDEQSSTVWGMPRAALEAGGAEIMLPLKRIGAALLAGWAFAASNSKGQWSC